MSRVSERAVQERLDDADDRLTKQERKQLFEIDVVETAPASMANEPNGFSTHDSSTRRWHVALAPFHVHGVLRLRRIVCWISTISAGASGRLALSIYRPDAQKPLVRRTTNQRFPTGADVGRYLTPAPRFQLMRIIGSHRVDPPANTVMAAVFDLDPVLRLDPGIYYVGFQADDPLRWHYSDDAPTRSCLFTEEVNINLAGVYDNALGKFPQVVHLNGLQTTPVPHFVLRSDRGCRHWPLDFELTWTGRS